MECPICDENLMSVYVRGGKVFDSLENRKYCTHCDMIVKIEIHLEKEHDAISEESE